MGLLLSRSAADGGPYGDLGSVGKGRGEAAGPPAALCADEEVDVGAHLASLGEHAVAHAGGRLPQRGERVSERDGAAPHLEVDPAAALREGPQRRGNEKG